MADVLSALALLFEPSTFIMCFVGMLVGVILGAIPGLAAGLAITVMLPISFTMKSTQAFALLMSIWVGGCSGSFIGSILLGIPGTPSSLATTFDGYAMTKKGQATRALSIGTLSNFLGTAPSIIIAMIACPLIASVAVKMGPWEYFALSFMAITLVVSISKGNMVKGFIGAGMGLLLTHLLHRALHLRQLLSGQRLLHVLRHDRYLRRFPDHHELRPRCQRPQVFL